MPDLLTMSLVALVALIVGAIGGRLFAPAAGQGDKVRLQERDRELQEARTELTAVRAEALRQAKDAEALRAVVQTERKANVEKLALLETAEQKLREAFAATSQEALERNNTAFLDLANTRFIELQRSAQQDMDTRKASIDQLVKPVQEGLQQVSERITAFDKERATAHSTLQEHLRLLATEQSKLSTETRTLVTALRAPQVRGQWGELQLRRVVELAGMLEHCDFTEQASVNSDNGRLRPDLIVRLPGAKTVVVDAKAPLAAYLDAMEATDETERGVHLDRHAKQVRSHIEALSGKDYSNQFSEAPDFVVLFLPGESFFSAACQRDPNLIDFAIQRGVIPSSPTTLITVLKAVNYGWQQERIGQNAEQIRDLGQQLYERVRTAAEHLAKVRKGLEAAVSGYNDAIGALERRVLPTARKFRELGAGTGAEIGELEKVESVPRLASAVELVEGEGPEE